MVDSQTLNAETWSWQIFDLNALPGLGDDVSDCLGASFLLLCQTEVTPGSDGAVVNGLAGHLSGVGDGKLG